MIDDLARTVADAEPPLDVDLGESIDAGNDGRDDRQEEITAEPAQRATLTTPTVRSCPSIFSFSVAAPSGAWPRATAMASVSVAM